MNRNFARQLRTRGFSLIEVLVALVITAIGLLGIAALVLFSMRASFESRQQTIASMLAVDVHERAWLDSHVFDPGTPRTCSQDWVQLGAFLPGGGLDDLTPVVGGTFPACTFTVTWDDTTVGVVGGMRTFGGEFTHNFIIPSN